MTTNYLTTTLEVKALNKREFEGYGSVFGNKDWGNDVVMPGAFSKTLSEHKGDGTLPMMFWMHDPSRIPGKWLTMEEDERGLYVKGTLAPTDLGNEIHTLLGMKAVSGLSIGYIPSETDYTDDGVRLIKSADLIETSIVSIPMNPRAQIAHAKSRLSDRGEYVPTNDEIAYLRRDVEQFLRKKGFSKNLSKLYVSNMFRETGEMPEPPVEMTELGTILGGKNIDMEEMEKESTGATPEEIEVNAGLKTFQEQQQAYELNQILARYFRNG